MPVVTLTFTLPEEQHECDETLRSGVAHAALWDIDQKCRGILKHASPDTNVAAILEEIRRMIPAECIQ
jgi:hypothetical protein